MKADRHVRLLLPIALVVPLVACAPPQADGPCVLAFRKSVRELPVIDASGGEMMRFRVSPDGTRAAFFRAPSQEAGGLWLFVSKADGTTATRISSPVTWNYSSVPEILSWGPASHSLAFTSYMGDFEISLVDVVNGSHTTIFKDRGAYLSNPTWSPDGQTIAFVREPKESDQPPELVLARPNGSIARRAAIPDESNDRSPYVSWAPASPKIAILLGNSCWLFDSATGTFDGPVVSSMANSALCPPHWSTDGRWVAWVAGPPGKVYGFDAELHQVCPPQLEFAAPLVAWLPGTHCLLTLQVRPIVRFRDILDNLRSGGHAQSPHRIVPTLIQFPERRITPLEELAWQCDDQSPSIITQAPFSTAFGKW